MSQASALEDWASDANGWLAGRLPARPEEGFEWGAGDDGAPVFHNVSDEDLGRLVERSAAWQRQKYDAGYGALTLPEEHGGAGLPGEYERTFAQLESRFQVPHTPELVGVTVGLIAPTIARLGTEEQRARWLRPMLRADLLACQLFSEPEAGSDLANVRLRAVREGGSWVLNGQKVWTSGAQFAQVGELIARTDPTAPKHRGMTAFIVPMDAPGVDIRPLRQMSGGTSFNEVFFNDVRIPDADRIGDVGDGWRVALTTLGFERGHSGRRKVGGSWEYLWELARHTGALEDPLKRQSVARAYTAHRLLELLGDRVATAQAAGEAPGPEGSLRKVFWVDQLRAFSETSQDLLGERLAFDHGEWGTYAWSEHVLGAPGFRIAGGSDEIQRNIIGERVLGLPAEPRNDKGPMTE
ncbi:acyl-CoA dehydrogenase family protein [Actinomadura rugatobispora]|uniref:Acyl-CoA dehydrogenase family protein n=1 Tax=Actinomadura rugatobispora TaxID=1994 RepID=A0ABW0ZUN3_9ACTN